MRRMAMLMGAAVVLTGCVEPTTPSVDEPLTPSLYGPVAPSLQAAALPATSSILDLGTLGGPYSSATDINASGQVVGASTLATGGSHAFLWTPEGGMRDLGTLGGQSNATAVNDLGQVVGYSRAAGDVDHAFLWSSSTGMLDLGDPGAPFSAARDVNNQGVVVGDFWVTGEPNERHAFLWTATDGMRDLGTMGGMQTTPVAVNDQGVIAGTYTPGTEWAWRAFVWTEADGFTDIGTLGGPYAEASDINNRGEVVGESETAAGDRRAFIWTKQGGMQPLAGLPPTSRLESINENGEAAGYAPGPTDSQGIFLTSDHDVLVLSSLGGSWSSGVALNTHGQIVGAASYPAPSQGWPPTHAVLWTLDLAVAVAIDIKPGTDANSVNVKAKGTGHAASGGGVLPVALLGDGSLDVGEVDIASLHLGAHTPVSMRGHGFMASLEDVDGDGDADLLLHFDVAALLASGDLQATTEELCLTGSTLTGARLKGCDAVRTVGG